MREIIRALLSFFYPRFCAACGAPLLAKEVHFCLLCFCKLPETKFHTLEHSPLEELFYGRIKMERIFTLLYYKKGSVSQKILQHIKYYGNKALAIYLGEYYGQQLKEQLKDIDILIPVPLHKKKLKKRGYNQSEQIALGIQHACGIPIRTDIILRDYFTETQTKKSRLERWENVKGKFSLNNELVEKGVHYLIIDDVLTTGATIEAVASQLDKIEGVKISVLTLAAAV